MRMLVLTLFLQLLIKSIGGSTAATEKQKVSKEIREILSVTLKQVHVCSHPVVSRTSVTGHAGSCVGFAGQSHYLHLSQDDADIQQAAATTLCGDRYPTQNVFKWHPRNAFHMLPCQSHSGHHIDKAGAQGHAEPLIHYQVFDCRVRQVKRCWKHLC